MSKTMSLQVLSILLFLLAVYLQVCKSDVNTCSDCIQCVKTLAETQYLDLKETIGELEGENRVVRKQIIDASTQTANVLVNLEKRLEKVEQSSRRVELSVSNFMSNLNKKLSDLQTKAEEDGKLLAEILKVTKNNDKVKRTVEKIEPAFNYTLTERDISEVTANTSTAIAPESPKTSEGQDKCRLSKSLDLMTLSNGKKYSMHNIQTKWEDAKHFCEAHGMHLPVAKTVEDMRALWNIVRGQPKVNLNDGWWLHATGKEFGIYHWMDGTTVEVDNGLWHRCHPRPLQSGGQWACITLWIDKLIELSCSLYKKPYFCELPSHCY